MHANRNILALCCAVMAYALYTEPATAGNTAGLGTPLTINNPGFESDLAPPGCFELLTPASWVPYDPNNILGGGDFLGVIDPTGTTNYPGGAPEGLNVALVFLDGQVGEGPMGLSQQLADTLQPFTTYTLLVQVGDIASGQGPPPCDTAGFFNLEGFPGYQVQLLAGGELLDQDNNTLEAVLDDGQFALSTVTYTSGGTHPQMGQPLEIRVINLNIPGTVEEPAIEVNFDDVMLFAAPSSEGVPTTSSWGMTIMLLLMLCIAAVTVMRAPRMN